MGKELDEKRATLAKIISTKKQLEKTLQENGKILNEMLPPDVAVSMCRTGEISEDYFLKYKNDYEALEYFVRSGPDVLSTTERVIENLRAEIKELEKSEEVPKPPISFPQPVKISSAKKRHLYFSSILLLFVCAVFAFVLFEFSYYARNSESEKAELLEKIEGLESEKAQLAHQKAAIVQERDELKQEIGELNGKDEKTDKELDLCYNRITLLVDQLWGIGYIVDGSKYYHYFECDVYTSADEYWAHNVEYCEYLGYSRCPICWYP